MKGVTWAIDLRTTAETQYLDRIPCLGSRKREQSGRKEHSLIVWMRNQEANALVAQAGESHRERGHDRRVEAGHDEQSQRQQPDYRNRRGTTVDAAARDPVLPGGVWMVRQGEFT